MTPYTGGGPIPADVEFHTVLDCPRCLKRHEILGWPIVNGPIRGVGIEYTHWAICVHTASPIVLAGDATTRVLP